MKDSETLVLMGPAETRIGLQHFLDDHAEFKGEIIGNVSADSMTNNQIKAAIREYFSKNKNLI